MEEEGGGGGVSVWRGGQSCSLRDDDDDCDLSITLTRKLHLLVISKLVKTDFEAPSVVK